MALDWPRVATLCGMLCAWSAQAAPAPDRISHGRFQNLAVYAPQGTPQSMVLLLADPGIANAGANLALALAHRGAMVAVIDVGKFDEALGADAADCVFPDGDLENLSHFVQAYYHLPLYRPPLLVGYGAGANLAYAVLAQAPAQTFAGAITVGFCPETSLRKPLCKGGALQFERTANQELRYMPAPQLDAPWVTLQGGRADRCGVDAIREFTAHMQGAAVVAVPAGNRRELERLAAAAPRRFRHVGAARRAG